MDWQGLGVLGPDEVRELGRVTLPAEAICRASRNKLRMANDSELFVPLQRVVVDKVADNRESVLGAVIHVILCLESAIWQLSLHDLDPSGFHVSVGGAALFLSEQAIESLLLLRNDDCFGAPQLRSLHRRDAREVEFQAMAAGLSRRILLD